MTQPLGVLNNRWTCKEFANWKNLFGDQSFYGEQHMHYLYVDNGSRQCVPWYALWKVSQSGQNTHNCSLYREFKLIYVLYFFSVQNQLCKSLKRLEKSRAKYLTNIFLKNYFLFLWFIADFSNYYNPSRYRVFSQ